MRTPLLVLFSFAISSVTAEEKLCNPVLEILNKTTYTITVKWGCSSTLSHLIKGFELHYKHQYRESFPPKTLDLAQHTFTLTDLHWGEPYEMHLKAHHRNSDVTERSESVQFELPWPIPCRPPLDITMTSLSSITVQWKCSETNPEPFEGYLLKYKRKENRYEDWKDVNLDNTQHEVTLKELTCGDTYHIIISVLRSKYVENDGSDAYVTAGGQQLYPERKEFLEVDMSSVILKLDRLKPNCPTKTFHITLSQVMPNKEINETRVESSMKQLVFSGLQSSTEYEVHVNVNEDFVGTRPSYTFKTKCEEKVLEVPKKEKLLELHAKYFVVHLEEWKCVDSFAVEYRKSESTHWNLISNDTKADQKSLLIQQLSKRASYDVRITARNKFGSSVAEYPKLKYVVQESGDCGDWVSYGEKCLKFVKEAGLLPKDDAQLVCNRLQENTDIPSLLTIHTELTDWRVTEIWDLPGPVWLGLQSDNGEDFYWDDGSEVIFFNWIKQLRYEKAQRCVQLLTVRSRYVNLPRWQRVNCNAWNYVVCEKPKPIPSGVTIDELLTTVEQLETNVGELMKRVTEAENKIKANKKN